MLAVTRWSHGVIYCHMIVTWGHLDQSGRVWRSVDQPEPSVLRSAAIHNLIPVVHVTESICTLCLCCCTLYVALSAFVRVWTSFNLLRMFYVTSCCYSASCLCSCFLPSSLIVFCPSYDPRRRPKVESDSVFRVRWVHFSGAVLVCFTCCYFGRH